MFFSKLSQCLTPQTSVNLTVHSQDGILSVSVFPKAKGLKDEAKNHLQPIVLTGTAQELDDGFFDAIAQPIEKASKMLAGMKQFETSLDLMETQKKETQEHQKNVDKQAQDRKAKCDKLISRAATLEDEEKYEDALKALREARTLADEKTVAKLDERIDSLKGKLMQSSLFSS